MLSIRGLHAAVGGKEILRGLDLDIPKSSIHVIMGPNGAGKSTLSHVLMGQAQYKVSAGSILLGEVDLSTLGTSERARAGLFLAFQYPVSIPGLRLSEYLRNLYSLMHASKPSVGEFRKILRTKLDWLSLDSSILNRYLNEGFSGGEMKRLEMLQLALSEPKVAILDEIDSGVDVDAQKIIGDCICKIRQETGTSFLIITHYQRILKTVVPDRVHVLLDGRIGKSGGIEVVESLEREGFDWARRQQQQ